MPLINTIEQAACFFEQLEKRDEAVVDVETSGLDWKKNFVVGYVFTLSPNPDDTYYIPVRHQGGNLYNEPAPESAESEVKPHTFEMNLHASLKHQPMKLIGHHLAFDLKFMTKHNINVTTCNFEDTMINAGLIDEYRSSYALEACCINARVTPKLGRNLYSYLQNRFGGSSGPKQMGNFWRLSGDDPMGNEYAMGDGISTYELWQQQQGVLDDQDLRTVWGIENRVIRVLHRMMMRGVKVNQPRIENTIGIVENRLIEAMKQLPEGVNLRSGSQMKELFENVGITDWSITDKGNPSFPEKWLLTNEIGRCVVAARKYRNLKDSFLSPLQNHLYKGRIHTEFNQSRSEDFGTITGRLSCSRPNMQQVPKRNEELGRLFRALFIPDEDMIWASADYSQCEPRLLAHYSKCKVMLEGYLADPPLDAHTAVAISAGIDRTSGKRLNQGLITGMGRKTAIEELGFGAEKGGEIYDQYFRSMPEIKRLQKDAARQMKFAGYIKSILGRRARYDTRGGRDTAYKAVNRLLQCGNADIIKKSMADIDDHLGANGDEVHMLLSIHDSLDFQFHEDNRKVFERALEIMEDFGPGRSVELRLPMVVDVGEGPNWEIASYGEA